MKAILIIFILLLLKMDFAFSQNGFSDAVLISRNRETYITQIKNILEVAPLNGRQREELSNLNKFLNNPWDSTIKLLNFKIVLEISKIIEGLSGSKNKVTDLLRLLNEDLIVKSNSLKQKETEKNTLSGLTDTTGLRSLEKYIQDLKEQIPKIESQIRDNDTVLAKIKSLENDPKGFDDFKKSVDKSIETVSMLGKDNKEETSQTVSNSNFSLSQAAIIDAIGNAIIEQVQESLVNELFEGILDKDFSVGKDTAQLKNELRIFFPRSIAIIENLRESRTDNYFTNLNITLKNSFSEDLKSMLENITCDSNINKTKIFRNFYYGAKGIRTQAYDYLVLSEALIKNIKNGFHPIEVIPILHDFLATSDNKEFNDFANYIYLIDVLQKNLRDIGENSKEIWINISSLTDLNTTTYPGSLSSAEFFMAIMYQTTHYRFIKNTFAPGESFQPLQFEKFKKDLSSFVINLRGIEKNINELTHSDQKSFNDYSQYLSNFMTLLDSTNGLMGNYFFDPAVTDQFRSYIRVFRKYSDYSMNIYKSITNGSYSKILPIVLEIFKVQFSIGKDSKEFRNEIIRYTNLYVDISTANSQNELNSAIGKAVHNSGGYLRKAEEPFNLSVDSYPGIFVSNERLNGSDYGKTNIGFTVPLGFNIQYDRFALFLQAFDIAAAVNYRFNNNSTTNLPSDVTFQQVFAPGLSFIFTPFPKFPLAFGLGLSVTPALREVNGSGVTLNDSKSTFYSFMISYNVPLWYLY